MLPQGVGVGDLLQLREKVKEGAVLNAEEARIVQALVGHDGHIDYENTGEPENPHVSNGEWHVKRHPFGIRTWNGTGYVSGKKQGEIMLEIEGDHFGNISTDGTTLPGGIKQRKVVRHQAGGMFTTSGVRMSKEEVQKIREAELQNETARRARAVIDAKNGG